MSFPSVFQYIHSNFHIYYLYVVMYLITMSEVLPTYVNTKFNDID